MNTKRLFLITLILVSLLSVYWIIEAIYISQTTGILRASSTDTSATISVEQLNHHSVNIGVGSASIHLQPGLYKVLASHNRTQAVQNVQIYKKTASEVNLSPTSAVAKNQLPKKVVDSNALTQLLPFTGPSSEYKVSYIYQISANAAQATIVITSPTTKGQQDALSWISKVGFNPSDLSIKYETAPVK